MYMDATNCVCQCVYICVALWSGAPVYIQVCIKLSYTKDNFCKLFSCVSRLYFPASHNNTIGLPMCWIETSLMDQPVLSVYVHAHVGRGWRKAWNIQCFPALFLCPLPTSACAYTKNTGWFTRLDRDMRAVLLICSCRNDEKTAADYKIQGGSVLHLVLALRGGF